MSCNVCGGLRDREAYNPAVPVILECQRSPACIKAAPSYFSVEEKIAAGVRRASHPDCTSNECQIRRHCTGAAACMHELVAGAPAALTALRAHVDELAAKREAHASTIEKIRQLSARPFDPDPYNRRPRRQPPSYADFMAGDARERDVYGQPVDDGRVGTWVQTASGHKLWPLDPRPGDIHLIDVARGLANECRFGRQMKRRGQWYSVAEHCVLVARYVAERFPGCGWEREALLHDGDEAYGFGDIPRPLKHDPRIKPLVQPIEERWQAAIFSRFGVVSTAESRAAIKEIDNLIILDEIPALMRSPEMYSIRYASTIPRLGASIACWSPPLAEVAFLVEFALLFPEHAAEARRLSASPEAA